MLLIPFFIFIFSKFFLLLFIYFNYDSLFFIQSLISIYWFFLIVFALIAVAFATLTERKVLAGVQRRRGPNVVGVFGFLQAIADGLKLVLKESIIPQKSNRAIFYLSSLFAFIVSFFSWGFIPFTNSGAFLDVNLGLLFILGLSSLHVYSVILSGWSSNSLYAFLGALRSSAQMISYEVGLTLFVLIVYLPVGSLNLIDIVLFQENNVWFILPFFPVAILYFIGMLAELNRTPFDLTEAESELVSGYNVEYSSLLFAFFFLGEYSNILFMSAFFSLIFLGGWSTILGLPCVIVFALKTCFIFFLVLMARAVLPRFRYDQLMYWGWKCYMPLALCLFFFYLIIFYI